MCNTTSHEDIDVVENIAKRDTKELKFILSDNCCKQKLFFNQHFPHCDVKLDIFHAVQRITKTVHEKTLPESLGLMRSFGLVFRQRDDLGEIRTMITPEPAEIMENIERFVTKNSSLIPSRSLPNRATFDGNLKFMPRRAVSLVFYQAMEQSLTKDYIDF